MTRYFSVFLAGMMLLSPLSPAIGAPLPQSVEEPDSPDDDAGMPDEPVPAVPPAPAVTPDVKPPANEAQEGDTNYDKVLLRVLNKVTARSESIEATLGAAVRFGTIEIIPHSCWKSAADERPENAALLEISEIKEGEAPTQIFMGWMFSSTPGIFALEHPFYDVTVVKCERTPQEKPQVPAAPKKPNAKSR